MNFPFRLGTTSYIIPADILPNVHYLADRVDDVELVLFEVDDGQNNLPSRETIRELNSVAVSHNLTYTVHLPLDLRLGEGGDESHVSLIKARKVIDCTRDLNPLAYVLHLDGKEIKNGATAMQVEQWRNGATRVLEIIGEYAGSAEKLAVENLERYPLDFILPVINRVAVSRCVDIGHLWLDSHDPLPYLREALPRTNVIHIHGIAERDHKSLAHTPPEKLCPVIDLLHHENFSGVLTLEVFGEEDFLSSVETLKKVWVSETNGEA